MIDRTFDVEEIKSRVDVRELVPNHGALHRESSKELSGPCPKCGGTDRFHCTADWWFCRQCHEKGGDAIDLVIFLGLASDFRTACDYLAAWNGMAPIPTSPVVAPVSMKSERKADSSTWQSPTWQREARALLEAATLRLEQPEGEVARAYLVGRGILPATWKAWDLGYAKAWHPKRNKPLPALILPWKRGDTIKALQYRFIGEDIMHGERFGQKAGGDRTVFGAHLVARREILLICEGELNACSFWQVGLHTVDVVSFGPQDNIDHASPFMNKLAGRYRHVLVWADEPEKAVKALLVVGGRAKAAISPRGKDANDLLQEGVLADVFAKVIAEAFGPTPGPQASSQHYTTLVYPAEACPVTVAGKWTRLDDGRIEASYTRVELIWAMAATGYEPTADEMALIAES